MRHRNLKKYILRPSHLRSIASNSLFNIISFGKIIVRKKISLYLRSFFNKEILSFAKTQRSSFLFLNSLTKTQISRLSNSTNCIQSLNLGTRLRDCSSITLLVFIYYNAKNSKMLCS
ncbi:hypothetical protein [Candidatus Vidania fulgoroideorum]